MAAAIVYLLSVALLFGADEPKKGPGPEPTSKEDNPPSFEQRDIFVAQGRAHYRIPSMVVATDGTVLAFASRLMDTVADNAKEVHVVLRRSLDGGSTWQPMRDLFAREGWVAGGTAIVDQADGAILLLYTRHPGTDSAKIQAKKEAAETDRFIARSTDNGKTWTHQKTNIAPNHIGVAACHGSAPGITLEFGPKKGRLLMPGYVTTNRGGFPTPKDLQKHYFNCAIYSDDHGKTWKTSGTVQAGTGEGCLVETSTGAIYYNSRAFFFDGKRRIARSYDSGETFTDFAVDQMLIEPNEGCSAGMVRIPPKLAGGRNLILFSNPANFEGTNSKGQMVPRERKRMTVRLSYDDGKSWPVSKVVDEGFSGYSALAVAQDGTILCLYERGEKRYNDKIAVARFNLQWLTDGKDSLRRKEEK